MLDVRYLADYDVSRVMDEKLRTLLTLCFDETFKDKRYCFEMPPHRWLVFDGGEIAAHLAIHEKVFSVATTKEAFIGIAEVCTAPSYRGRGLVKATLKEAEAFLPKIKFAILLGDPGVYGSSGYRRVNNVYLPYENELEPNEDVLIKTLQGDPWPEEKVAIDGPPF